SDCATGRGRGHGPQNQSCSRSGSANRRAPGYASRRRYRLRYSCRVAPPAAAPPLGPLVVSLAHRPWTPPPAPPLLSVLSVSDASCSCPSVVRLVHAHAVHQCRVRACVRLRRLHEAAMMLLYCFLSVICTSSLILHKM